VVSAYPERHDSLWWVALAPGIWAAHFTLSYASAAVWCAKYAGPGASLSLARLLIAVYSALALAALGALAWRGLRNYRLPAPQPRTDSDTSAARHRFVGFTVLALSSLSALAVVYEALAVVFIGSCH
jgi:hypothetical protein